MSWILLAIPRRGIRDHFVDDYEHYCPLFFVHCRVSFFFFFCFAITAYWPFLQLMISLWTPTCWRVCTLWSIVNGYLTYFFSPSNITALDQHHKDFLDVSHLFHHLLLPPKLIRELPVHQQYRQPSSTNSPFVIEGLHVVAEPTFTALLFVNFKFGNLNKTALWIKLNRKHYSRSIRRFEYFPTFSRIHLKNSHCKKESNLATVNTVVTDMHLCVYMCLHAYMCGCDALH